MARAGARLVEVGTTNRTHLKDYEGAIGDGTGLILKVHTSNYLHPGLHEVGVGARSWRRWRARTRCRSSTIWAPARLVDLARYGLEPEPTVREAVAEGADLVTFSGDKLLGGPQAGFIAGRKDLVARVAKNPMKRALRLDKIRLAALEATLKLYRDPDRLARRCRRSATSRGRRPRWRQAASRLRQPIAGGGGRRPMASTSPIAPARSAPARCRSRRCRAPASPSRPWTARAPAAGWRRWSRRCGGLPCRCIGHVKDGALILDLRCLDDEARFLAQLAQLPARLAALGGDACSGVAPHAATRRRGERRADGREHGRGRRCRGARRLRRGARHLGAARPCRRGARPGRDRPLLRRRLGRRARHRSGARNG